MSANLPNLKDLISAGINPKNGLPLKLTNSCDIPYPGNIKEVLRTIDLQDAVNRYTWYNLPDGLDQQLLERILYFKGQGCFFYYKQANKFLFLPYALTGNIDVYGRFIRVVPQIFNGSYVTDSEKKKDIPFINNYVKEVQYEVDVNWIPEDMDNKCVLLRDYTNGLSENIVARAILQEPILELMSEAYPLARTALFANSGVKGIRVQSDDEALSVMNANSQVKGAALGGKPFIPVVGKVDFQELTESSAIKSQEYLLYMQSLDSFRLSAYGLETGGIFQKKAHMLEGEMEMNAGHAKLCYQDGLALRQRFCDIVNSIWGLGIWCDVSESALGIDLDQDGDANDDHDQSGMSDNGPELGGVENE